MAGWCPTDRRVGVPRRRLRIATARRFAPPSGRAAGATRQMRRISAASVVVEALLDELLLHRPTVRVEAGELELLLELEVHVVLATTVLLDRHDDPVAEALRLVRVELDVDLG